MMTESKFRMKLLRPKMGVGTKTWIGFSIVFWLPILTLVITLFFLLKTLLKDETLGAARIYLQSTEDIFNERANTLKELLVASADTDEVKRAFVSRDRNFLQKYSLELGRKFPYATILISVDENFRIISDKKGSKRTVLNIGKALSQAVQTGQTQITTELMSSQFLSSEDIENKKLVGTDAGLVQFVIYPVKNKDKVIGAFIAGILLTGDPWLGNTVYNRYGVEMAIFAGERIDSARLHVSPSLPRNNWEAHQLIPSRIKNEVAFGKSFSGEIENQSGETVFVVFKPVKDSKESIIGTIGLGIPHSETNSKIIKPIAIATGITAVIGFLIAVAITALVRYDITHPIQLLQVAMDALGRGEVNTRVDLLTGDEFERLGEGFNKMATGILQREDRLRKHYEVTKLLMSTLDLQELIQKMLKIVVEVTESQLGIVYLADQARQKFIPRAHYGAKATDTELDMTEGYPGIAVEEKKHILINPGTGSILEEIDFGFTRAIPAELAYIPLVYNETIMGILILGTVDAYSQEEVTLFDYLANQIAIALDNAILHNKVQELSITDNLTGLNNRHYLNVRLDEMWSKAGREKSSISILLADIDNFKTINDTYGHKSGDEVLAAIGKVFRRCARKEDCVARYGGEEFVVVMENTTKENSLILAERIRTEVQRLEFQWLDRSVTLSIGVAIYPESGSLDPVALTQAADQAMYLSKTTGKNRVTLFNPGI